MNRLVLALSCSVLAASLLVPMLARAEDRDPFRPFIRPVEVSPDPLQRVSLDALHLEGIISGISAPRAMVRAPDGLTYEVGIGSAIGNQGGHIAQITKDAIVVVERHEAVIHEVVLGLPG